MMIHSRFLALSALASLAVVNGVQAFAAEYPHEKPGAASAKGHWAHLEGHFGDNDKLRALLVKEVQECAATMQKAGVPHKAPQPDEIPALVQPMELDFYHAPNRVAKFQKGKVYGYNPIDCSLTELSSEKITIMSAKGICNIDMQRKFATGVCDKAVHAGAPQFVHVNYNMIATDPALKKMLPAATGGKKSIAGLQCDVYEMTFPVQGSYCTSKSGSFLATGVQSLNSNVPGLQLEVRTADRENLVATQAKLDMPISDAVFQLPAGVKLRTLPGGMK